MTGLGDTARWSAGDGTGRRARGVDEGSGGGLGRVTVIRGQTVLAIAGVLLFVFSPTTPLAFAAVILWGLGASQASRSG